MTDVGQPVRVGRFFRRRELLLPTWRVWVLILMLMIFITWACGRLGYSFFAMTRRVPARVLAVEGWVPDYALQFVADEIKQGRVDNVFVTGGPLEYGAPLSEYGTYAEVGTAVLLRNGLSTNQVEAVPSEWVKQDRTYTSAVYLARYFKEHAVKERAFNVVSMGAHARRSRMLFEKAFGKNVEIGVISIPYVDFDPKRWYTTSAGVRLLISEMLAYVYARALFWPEPEAALEPVPTR